MIRLRVGDLDSWLDYAHPQYEDTALSTTEFEDRMHRRSVTSGRMLAGNALHKLLEHAKPGDSWGVDDDGVMVDGVSLQFAVEKEFALPFEREPEITEHTFETPSGLVLLRGRIDGRELNGTVVDYKLSDGFNAERYARSMQWRSYLLMKKQARFKYLIFQAKSGHVYDEVGCFWNAWIHEVHEFVQWSYPEMEADVQEIVSELAEYVVKNVPALVRTNP